MEKTLATALDDRAQQLIAAVGDQLNGRLRELRVSVRDDGLVLEGWAPTYYVKQLAQHVAMKHSGLPIHANQIVVA